MRVLFLPILSIDLGVQWLKEVPLPFLHVGMLGRALLIWLLVGSLGIWGSFYWICETLLAIGL